MEETAFWNLLGAVVLIGLMIYRYFRKQAALDTYRDQIHMVREGWFDLALDSSSTLEFEQPVYREFESTLFDLLETSEHMSMVHLIVILLQKASKRRSLYESVRDQISDTYTCDQAAALWRRLCFYLHYYYCSSSIVYAGWAAFRALAQPAKPEPVPDMLPAAFIGRLA